MRDIRDRQSVAGISCERLGVYDCHGASQVRYGQKGEDMFKRRRTRIAEKLKIVGSVTAEGAVEVNGDLEGDLTCAALDVSRKAQIRGSVQADRIVVNGRIEGPISGRIVVLKSHAYVVGDIMAKSLSIEKGAFFDGRSASVTEPKQDREHLTKTNGEKKVTKRPTTWGEPPQIFRARIKEAFAPCRPI